MPVTRVAGLLVCGLLLVVQVDAQASNETPLVDAAKNQDFTRVASLLTTSVDVDRADAEEMTALHWAAHWNHSESVQLLLEAGADAGVSNRYGVTPLHEASTMASVEIVRALLEAGADPNAAYGAGETPLMTAARTGNAEVVRLLIDHGGNVNAFEQWRGQTALMWAAVENHPDVARLLIDHGAEVNTRSTHYEFQTLTGGAGGIIHDRPEGSITALHLAARQGAMEVAEVLIDAGADLDAEEPQYGFTPMQTSVFNGHYDFAAQLMDRGADLNDGSLYIAIEMKNLGFYNNRPNPPAVDVTLSSLDIVNELLSRGADPNQVYSKEIPPRQAQGDINVTVGATALFRAARAVDLETIEALVVGGADPNIQSSDGSTPLMLAAGRGARGGGGSERLEAVHMMLAAGSDVHLLDESRNTALHYAAQTGADQIVELLMRVGADSTTENRDGRTALDMVRDPDGSTAMLLRQLSQE